MGLSGRDLSQSFGVRYFTFQPGLLLVGEQWFGKSVSFRVLQSVLFLQWSKSSIDEVRSVSFLSLNVSRRLVFSFKIPNHQFTMELVTRSWFLGIGHPLQILMLNKRWSAINGCEGNLGRSIHHLSGGEKQKAALAVLLCFMKDLEDYLSLG